MKSFAPIDRIEGKYAVCELELLPVEETDNIDCETVMVDIPLENIPCEVQDGDILVIEHDGEEIIFIHSKDDIERQRRVEKMQAIMNTIMGE